jgi:hypothetical protein
MDQQNSGPIFLCLWKYPKSIIAIDPGLEYFFIWWVVGANPGPT